MLDLSILSPATLGAIRQHLGYAADDAAGDAEISQLAAGDAFHAYCNWHALRDWGRSLYATVHEIDAADSQVVSYTLQSTSGSICPECQRQVDLLAPKLLEHFNIAFYICWRCRFIGQIGVGPVPHDDHSTVLNAIQTVPDHVLNALFESEPDDTWQETHTVGLASTLGKGKLLITTSAQQLTIAGLPPGGGYGSRPSIDVDLADLDELITALIAHKHQLGGSN